MEGCQSNTFLLQERRRRLRGGEAQLTGGRMKLPPRPLYSGLPHPTRPTSSIWPQPRWSRHNTASPDSKFLESAGLYAAALLLFVRRCPAQRVGPDRRGEPEGKRRGRRGFARWSSAPLGSCACRRHLELGAVCSRPPATGRVERQGEGGRSRVRRAPEPGLRPPGRGAGRGWKLSLSGGGLGSARRLTPGGP